MSAFCYSIAGRIPTATQRCLDCNKQLCNRCVNLHKNTKVTQNHTLYSLESATELMCREHEDEAIRYKTLKFNSLFLSNDFFSAIVKILS